MSEKTRYYKSFDEDFHQTGEKFLLKRDYKWINNGFFLGALSSLIYGIAFVISTVYLRLILGVRFVGAEKLKKQEGGFFLFGNHTHSIGDVFNPALMCFPKRIYTIVSPANLHLPIIGKLLPYLGALPTPSGLSEMRKFTSAIKTRYSEGHPIVIYPEAHLWDYYTDIRPFSEGSFYYPLKLKAPVYCFTTTYQKRRLLRSPKITVYVDGPFSLGDEYGRAGEKKLSLDVYKKMKERSKHSTYQYLRYIKK